MSLPAEGDPEGFDGLTVALGELVQSGTAPGMVFGFLRGTERRIGALGSHGPGVEMPMARDTIFRIASMTKPVAGLLATTLALEGLFALNDPIDGLIPEMADRRVLRSPDAALDDTIPAARAITVEDLLTCRMGMGHVMQPGRFPLMEKLSDLSLTPGPYPPLEPTESWIAKLGTLPLLEQPGTVWRYDTGLSVLGIFLERATGQSLETLFRQRVFEPLGMTDTGFHVPAGKLHRLPQETREDGSVDDPAGPGSRFAKPPIFHSTAAGLVSTADDLLNFAGMMLNKGEWRGRRIVPARAVDLMSRDRITEDQRRKSPFVPGFWDRNGWGYGVGISYPKDETDPAGIGWAGGTGTNLYWDPATGSAGVILTQRLFGSPTPPVHFGAFWRHARRMALT
ncbi:MAG: serine hydrolase domain-containing protein [Alphaproteobacteria bacterium]|nr:serine hydrolase domain-containing protein [Alphaproteobacteria bacterium]